MSKTPARDPHPVLAIGGQRFAWRVFQSPTACYGCHLRDLDGGYSGLNKGDIRGPGESAARPLAFCEACGRQRATGTRGRAVVDGATHACRVELWSYFDPDRLAVVVEDLNIFVGEGRSGPLVNRRIPVGEFAPIA